MTEEERDPRSGAIALMLPGPPPGPVASRSPGRPSGPLVWMALGVAALFGLFGGPAAMTAGRSWWRPLDRAALTIRQQALPGSARGGSDTSGQASARTSAVRQLRVRTELQLVLDAQATALLHGDEAAFVAPADPSEGALIGELRRRFGTLRAMKVMGWSETLGGDPEPVEGGWRAIVKIGYCFVVAGCQPVTVPVATRWTDRAGPLSLVEFGSSGPSDLGPRPWEISELRVAVGPRTVVAVPVRYAGRLDALLAAAEEAAAVADRYARWSAPPGRYLVYLAGPEEWGSWYGARQAEWVAGFALPITERHTEIVLNGPRVTGTEVEDTLRHEFAHVVTLADVRRDYSRQWWLVEGVAEYVRMVGRPLSEYELLSSSRRYVRAGKPTTVAALAEPAADASAEDASGRYGVAFLSVRWLAERFGEEKMLRFFDEVVRQGIAAPDAAAGEFGAGWGEITGECAGYVERSLG
ncbi:hypothetical protein [Planosporangium mesophilum]|uniref:Peptidase MA-like domain-containing protein n=1 Tax=Planosporangium mesophilum TaxID=689768 RepID=A0A8J3TAL7_9ACTN|nr:hypothetical protein [Planosporangium mesophilum]NJC81014.1 hypothetical protein [Planosporangium mesophilum]GII21344.1 hypothetical protein Pme01_09410 [Planosporangium mesophilum]